MPRYRVTLEYDGTPFVGWQMQALGVSVQGRLTEAIGKFSGETRVAARRRPHRRRRARAGPGGAFRPCPRLAAGHRARGGQLPSQARPDRHRSTAPSSPTISTRASARLARHYRYRILARPAPPVLDRDRVWWVPQPMRIEPMRAGGAGAGRPARLHHLPRRRLPGQVADQDARPPGGDAPAARRSTSTPPRARSCTTRCARWSAR